MLGGGVVVLLVIDPVNKVSRAFLYGRGNHHLAHPGVEVRLELFRRFERTGAVNHHINTQFRERQFRQRCLPGKPDTAVAEGDCVRVRRAQTGIPATMDGIELQQVRMDCCITRDVVKQHDFGIEAFVHESANDKLSNPAKAVDGDAHGLVSVHAIRAVAVDH